MAPAAGLEPATGWLTATYSTDWAMPERPWEINIARFHQKIKRLWKKNPKKAQISLKNHRYPPQTTVSHKRHRYTPKSTDIPGNNEGSLHNGKLEREGLPFLESVFGRYVVSCSDDAEVELELNGGCYDWRRHSVFFRVNPLTIRLIIVESTIWIARTNWHDSPNTVGCRRWILQQIIQTFRLQD